MVLFSLRNPNFRNFLKLLKEAGEAAVVAEREVGEEAVEAVVVVPSLRD
jgi:hypothetical protein